jgi:AcrR family transcriptional regulator
MSLPTSSPAPAKSATVGNIMDAAAELFVARNYADVTVDQVAEKAEVTKGAVYHHFKNKEQLYVAMLRADLERKHGLHERAAAIEGSCRVRLRALTAAFLELPDNERQLIELVRRDANIFAKPLRDELVRAYQRALPDPVEAIIRDGIVDGEIIPCDPRLLAWQFVALVEVLLTPYASERFANNEDKLNYVMSTFFYGCARSRKESAA